MTLAPLAPYFMVNSKKLDSESKQSFYPMKNAPELTPHTTLQSMVNVKLSLHGFWHCHENRLIKMIQTIPHNLHASFKLASLYYGLRLILVYPNSQ